MSIFDRNSPADPSDWLKEKTLRALQDAVRFVDLANEPDTTVWYAKRLKELAEPLVAHLLPVSPCSTVRTAKPSRSKPGGLS